MTSDTARPLLVYLHGFNSSPRSAKVAELVPVLPSLSARCGLPEPELQVPELGFDPAEAIRKAEACVQQGLDQGRTVGLVGSSLGGFYVSVLSARYSLPAAMINPAVYPYRLLADYLGPQHNPYTGERYLLGPEHMTALASMDNALAQPEKLLLLLQTGDETLDYREALQKHRKAAAWIQPGGDHRFQDFPRVVPAILAFLFGYHFR